MRVRRGRDRRATRPRRRLLRPARPRVARDQRVPTTHGQRLCARAFALSRGGAPRGGSNPHPDPGPHTHAPRPNHQPWPHSCSWPWLSPGPTLPSPLAWLSPCPTLPSPLAWLTWPYPYPCPSPAPHLARSPLRRTSAATPCAMASVRQSSTSSVHPRSAVPHTAPSPLHHHRSITLLQPFRSPFTALLQPFRSPFTALLQPVYPLVARPRYRRSGSRPRMIAASNAGL